MAKRYMKVFISNAECAVRISVNAMELLSSQSFRGETATSYSVLPLLDLLFALA